MSLFSFTSEKEETKSRDFLLNNDVGEKRDLWVTFEVVKKIRQSPKELTLNNHLDHASPRSEKESNDANHSYVSGLTSKKTDLTDLCRTSVEFEFCKNFNDFFVSVEWC